MARKTLQGVHHSSVHTSEGRTIPVRGDTSKEVAPRRAYIRSEEFELAQGDRDRQAPEPDQRQHVGSGPVVHCVDCVNLLYLDGVPKCAEFKFLIWPEALRDGIECRKQMRYKDLLHFKVFNGTSNNAIAVVEELMLEAIISLAVLKGRYVTISEIDERIQKMNKSSIYPVLRRLMQKGKVLVERSLVYHVQAPRRKYWKQDVYLPTILKDKIKNTEGKIVIGGKGETAPSTSNSIGKTG